jgi:hypothetical protein
MAAARSAGSAASRSAAREVDELRRVTAKTPEQRAGMLARTEQAFAKL